MERDLPLTILFTRKAQRQMRNLPIEDRDRAQRRLDAYAAEPAGRNHDVIPIVGSGGALRLRVGDWRVLFVVYGNVLEVQQVLHRREAYR